jgi:peptide/nickel transport system substrate-binding protein
MAWAGAPETGFSVKEFDAKLNDALSIVDANKRRSAMEDIERILQSSGVIIQPYWRKVFAHSVASLNQMHLEQVWLEKT